MLYKIKNKALCCKVTFFGGFESHFTKMDIPEYVHF